MVVKADEFEQAGQPAFICSSSAFATPLGVTVRKFTISGNTLYLTTAGNNNGYGVKYVVGSGGFTFADGCTASAYYAVRYATNSARIDPSADYSIGVNPLNANNYSFRNLSSTVYFGTTDANDHETPRTTTTRRRVPLRARVALAGNRPMPMPICMLRGMERLCSTRRRAHTAIQENSLCGIPPHSFCATRRRLA